VTRRFPVIIGPTAGGKSDLAVSAALAFRDRHAIACEILTADAIQVYRGLDIGAAKPTPEEQRGIAHRLIDVVDPRERFSVDAWLELAEHAVADCHARGVVPIVVGGTHLYVKAFLEGLFEGPEPDEALRAELRAMEPGVRRAELERVDPAAASRLHPNDERRTVRALEVYRLTGIPISEHQRQWDAGKARRDCVLVGLDWDVEALNRRVNARVKLMMERGLLDEVRSLRARSMFGPQSREALGYKQILEHLDGGVSLEEAAERIKIETRRFAKNQRTWMRRLRTTPGSVWVPMPGTGPEDAIQVLTQTVLGSSDRGAKGELR
jgi:tRNA dimethylallyltransferase